METMDVVEMTKAMVAIPSITGDEGRLMKWVADRLEAGGWLVTRQPVPPEGKATTDDPRINVIAKSDDGDPSVVFTTHLDTVPPYIEPTEDHEHLFGRGVCDAKGIFAAQWIAAEKLRAEGRRGIALLAVAGEETDSIGAKIVHQALPRADYLIDGEPTDLELSSGAKGILALTLRVKGVAGHSAYPERGKSATHALIQALGRLLMSELPYQPAFGATTVNVGVLGGGVAPNVIAPGAEARLMVRLGAPADAVLGEITDILGSGIEIEVTSKSEPHRIHVPAGRKGKVVRFASDVPYLAKIGTPLLVGPGSIHDAHTAGEKVRKDDLLRAVDLYHQLALALLEDRST
jgi:acetylornithine deacetylase